MHRDSRRSILWAIILILFTALVIGAVTRVMAVSVPGGSSSNPALLPTLPIIHPTFPFHLPHLPPAPGNNGGGNSPGPSGNGPTLTPIPPTDVPTATRIPPPMCPSGVTTNYLPNMAALSATESAPAADSSGEGSAVPNVPEALTANGCLLTAWLDAANELKNGAPGGHGAVIMSMNMKTGQVCADLTLDGASLNTVKATLLRGNSRAAGVNVMPLLAMDSMADDKNRSVCMTAPSLSTVWAVLYNPLGYYVEVTSSEFPNGAMRGQLTGAVQMGGAVEVPPGDPSGFGVASVMVDSSKGQVCYGLLVKGLSSPITRAYIHKGVSGQAGPAVVPFPVMPDDAGLAGGCADNVDPSLISALVASPGAYYVNVYNDDFSNGALRGQLSK